MPHTLGGPGNLLITAGNNEISGIHRDQVGGKLAGEMILRVVFLPVQVGIQIFGLFQGMSNATLRHSQPLRQQSGDQIAVGVITNDQIGPGTQFGQDDLFRLHGEAFEVGPNLEAGDPVGDNFAPLSAEWHPHDPRPDAADDRLQRLIAIGGIGLGNETGNNQNLGFNIQPQLVGPALHFPLQGPHLVQNVHHLTAGIRQTQNVGLTKIAVG